MRDIDLLLAGGEILTPGGRFQGAIGIEGEKVAFLSTGWSPPAKQTIDLQGKIVAPGFIDSHVHFRDPGLTHKEDFTTGSRAAAAGGITCVAEMPNTKPAVNTAERFKGKLEAIRNKSVVDYALYSCAQNPDEIPAILEAGAIGIKVFMVADPKSSYPHDPELFTGDDGVLYEILKRVAAEGTFCAIHPTNQEIFSHESRKCWAAGETGPRHWMNAYFGEKFISDDTAVSTGVILASAAHAQAHFLHLRTEKGMKMIRAARNEGERISIEVNPKYMLLGGADVDRLGPFGAPYGLTADQQAVLWRALNDGWVDVLASDHAPHTAAEQEPGWKDAWSVPLGNPQLDHFLSVLLTKVNEGATALETVVRACSEGPAKLLGIYPRKGVIQVGSDADLTVLDLRQTGTLSNHNLYTKVGRSPYEGRKYRGRPVMTIVRGRVVMQDGRVVGEPGWGRFIAGVRRESRRRAEPERVAGTGEKG